MENEEHQSEGEVSLHSPEVSIEMQTQMDSHCLSLSFPSPLPLTALLTLQSYPIAPGIKVTKPHL